jgi:hypothetical protein
VLKTKISSEIAKENQESYEFQVHDSALKIKQELKVTSSKTPTILTFLGRYLKRFVLLGFALLGLKSSNSTKRGNMNEEESYTKPPPEVPEEIFDNTTESSQDEKLNLDKFGIEKPFACRICHGAFADPQDLKIHVEKRSCRKTEQGKLEPPIQEATIRSAPGGEIEKEPKPPEMTVNNLKDDYPALESLTQEATNWSAPGDEAEKKVISKSDSTNDSNVEKDPGQPEKVEMDAPHPTTSNMGGEPSKKNP